MPHSSSQSVSFGQLPPSEWPGERLGLPQTGPRSVGRLGRRLAAVAIDWALATAASALFFNYDTLAISLIFVGMQIVFIPTLGGSIGQRMLGMRVVALAGGWVGLWRPIVRSILLGIVVPALVWDSDQRGFHDKIAGTVLIRA
ncbi:RDD family protein [Glaciibacter psychrotolerans]|uniref:Putative RDD family membrane protein YckC n=1 Tax=Glaciibacter psychrotolerans TaxID=670054 RepID=A0A7Z0ECS2_9MICO|nr:putative RDD family membrane protein YckC [Leifsonia psychrotolerans]